MISILLRGVLLLWPEPLRSSFPSPLPLLSPRPLLSTLCDLGTEFRFQQAELGAEMMTSDEAVR
uniref:Uncharacterized protein n=1 Tax=Oryza glumipatula TaxID=40148 RepID=A0A0D9Y551_9ORYZ